MIGADIGPHAVGHALKVIANQTVIEHQSHREEFNAGVPGWRQSVASPGSHQFRGRLEVTEQRRPRRQIQIAQHDHRYCGMLGSKFIDADGQASQVLVAILKTAGADRR